jgi:hypothetical protein
VANVVDATQMFILKKLLCFGHQEYPDKFKPLTELIGITNSVGKHQA